MGLSIDRYLEPHFATFIESMCLGCRTVEQWTPLFLPFWYRIEEFILLIFVFFFSFF